MFTRSILIASLLATSTAVSPAAFADAPLRSTGIDWRACPSETQPDKQCGYLAVPRVYGRPGAGEVRIAVARVPATGTQSERIGSLFWDAGGPGGASTQMLDAIAERMSGQVRAHFDIVAFDPRGIGASKPALKKCPQPWPVLPADSAVPDWVAAQRASSGDLARANRKCLRASGSWIAGMGTNNVARDLDQLRKAVGDKTLTFWATSYGTRIGYVYALRYPDRVRAMVLDGSIDPTHGYRTLPRVGGTSQDSALSFMKRTYRSGYRAITLTAETLTDRPITLADGTTFSRWDWLNLAGNFLAFQSSWPQIEPVAEVVKKAGGKGAQARAARAQIALWKDLPNTNEGGGFSVVNCLDYADRLTPAEQAELATRNAGGYFDGTLTLQYAMGCEGLSALDPDPIPLVTTDAQRKTLAGVPALLANSTHDGSTPMKWAKRMQRVFDRPMIRYQGTQHVIWGAVDSPCVNRPIDRFVIGLRIPKRDRTCPFAP